MIKTGAVLPVRKFHTRVLLPLMIICAVSACVTKPDPVSRDYAALLFEEGGIYMQLKPRSDKQLTYGMLTAAGMDSGSMAEILERTDEVFTFYTFGEKGLSFIILGQGSYPDAAAAISLRGSKEWERVKGKYSWWSNIDAPLKLSFVDNDLVCISNGNMEEILRRIYTGPAKNIPEEVKLQLNMSAMGIYASRPDFPSGQLRIFGELESFWMTFQSDSSQEQEGDGKYLIDAEYVCVNQSAARSLYLLLRLNLLSAQKDAKSTINLAALKEKDPVKISAEKVILEDYPISIQRINWFFDIALPFVDPIVNGGKQAEED